MGLKVWKLYPSYRMSPFQVANHMKPCPSCIAFEMWLCMNTLSEAKSFFWQKNGFALPGRHAKSKHEIRINKCFMTERWE